MTDKSRKPLALFLSLPVLAWALYDFSNTIFSANIVTLFFPQYITEIIGTDARLEQISSTVIAYANAPSALFLILFSPLFGVLMDRSRQPKKYIIIFTLLTVGSSLLLALVGGMITCTVLGIPNGSFLPILLFVCAEFPYSSGNVFYDGMQSSLGSKKGVPLMSGVGVALGYLGTLFCICSVLIIV